MDLNTIYLICAVAGGTVLVLRLLLMLIGLQIGADHGDVPPDLDMNIDADSGDHGVGGEVNYLSIQSLSGFFTMFGLVGMGLLQIQATQLWSLVGALAAGIVTAWASGMIVLTMQRLQSTGTMVISNAIGQQGTVYLTIPERGTGIVNVTVQGALRQFDAISESGEKIPTGEIVRVNDISAGNLLVVVRESVGKPSAKQGG
jgi:hypothetical protein